MARPSKYETEVKHKLDAVIGWARDGLSNEQIAHNLGIKKTAFYDYQAKHTEFANAIKKGKEVSDYEVENALFKRATGYSYDEVTKESKYNEETGNYELRVTKIVTKQVAPDTASMIFWLKNRKPNQWQDTYRNELSGTVQTPQIVNDAPTNDKD